MSEIINNREYRQQVLKELIGELHDGKSVDEVKARFEKLIDGVSTTEITEMEQALIAGGMPVEEIQRLCDVHAAVFKGSIEEIHREVRPEETPGHPVYTMKQENRALEKLIRSRILPHTEALESGEVTESLELLARDLEELADIDAHYSRKENLLFPYMEKYDITAPPKVMWGVDDEIRDEIRDAAEKVKNYDGDSAALAETIRAVATRVDEMIFKEENILFPMVLDIFTVDEWAQVAESSGEFGYTLITPETGWEPGVTGPVVDREFEEELSHEGYVRLDTGVLSVEEINGLLNTLPLDMTFVDKDGVVKYFSQGKDRVFARPKTIIGREVHNCHPPTSVHIVEKIVEDLKAGRKDHEDFWIRMGEKFVYIRYFAVRDYDGKFLGILEVTQDIASIQELSGEKRLLDEE